MNQESPRRALFLDALARLHPSWIHETRSHLGSLSLQLDLVAELLQATPGGVDPARLGVPLQRARGAVDRLEHVLGRTLGASRARPAGLAALFAEVDELVAPAARDRRIAWRCAPPAEGDAVPCDAEAVREWIVVLAVEALFAARAGDAVELRAEGAAGGLRAVVSAPGDAAASRWAASLGGTAPDGPRPNEGLRHGRREWSIEFETEGAGA